MRHSAHVQIPDRLRQMSDQQFAELADRLLRRFQDQHSRPDHVQPAGPIDPSSTAAGNSAELPQLAGHSAHSQPQR